MNPSHNSLGNVSAGSSRQATVAIAPPLGPNADPVRSRPLYAVPVRAVAGGSGRMAEALYRGGEILFAIIALIATLPIMLIVAAIVRADSPGPVLFRHRRPAQSRTMRGADLPERHDVRPAARRQRNG